MNYPGFPVGTRVLVNTRNYYSGPARVVAVQKKYFVVWMLQQQRQQTVPKRLCAVPTFIGWIYFSRDGDLRVTQTWPLNDW